MAHQKIQSVSTGPLSLVVDNSISKPSKPKVFGGGGGGLIVDAETKNYLDAKVDAVKAQNDARFAEVLGEIRAIRPGASWQQIAGTIAVAVTFIFAILAYASDRFDGGLAAIGIKEQIASDQLLRDTAQDAKLDRILGKLNSITLTAPNP